MPPVLKSIFIFRSLTPKIGILGTYLLVTKKYTCLNKLGRLLFTEGISDGADTKKSDKYGYLQIHS